MKKIIVFITVIILVLSLNSCSTVEKNFFGIQVYSGHLTFVKKTVSGGSSYKTSGSLNGISRMSYGTSGSVNGNGGVLYRTSGSVNGDISVFCKINQFNDHLTIYFTLRNNGYNPIQPNYFLDEYTIVDYMGRQYELSFSITSYPLDPINPGSYDSYYSKDLYTNLMAEDVKFITIYLGYDEILIETLPYETIIK